MKKIFIFIFLVAIVLLQIPMYNNNLLSYMFLIPGLLIGFIICVFVHELGHLVFGLFSGYKFTSFRILFVKIFKKDKINICFEKSSILIPGQCLMKPTSNKYFLYNIGGLIFTYIFSILLLVLFYTVNNEYLIQFIFGIFIINTILGVINSIYSKYAINDISNIVKCKKNSQFLEAMLYQLDIISNIYIEGKFKSKYNPCDDVDDLVTNVSLYRIRYYKAYKEKNFDRMEHYYKLLKKKYNNIHIAVLKIPILILLLNHEFIFKSDVSSVKRRLKRISKKESKIISKFKAEYDMINFYRENVVFEKDIDDSFFDEYISTSNDLFEKLNNDIYSKLKRVFRAYVRKGFILEKRI